MRCRDCAEGKPFAAGSYFCVMYGMIVREKDKCTRKGARRRERDEGDSGQVPEADPAGDVGRVPAGEVPGVLSGSGEREGFPGMEGREG